MAADPLVSVVFITYNRIHLLCRTLESFLANTDYPELELIVADDGSPREVQEQIRALPVQKTILPEKNRGMGANANAGLRAASGKYILFLQDDWLCNGPSQYLREAVSAIEQDPSLGMVRFYGIERGAIPSRVSENTEGILVLERPTPGSTQNRNYYSDTPHLRSRAMLEELGWYTEGTFMEQCEVEYQDRYLARSALSVAYFDRYMNRVFTHVGEEESFRTTSTRARIERRVYDFAEPLRGKGRAYQVLRWSYRGLQRLAGKLGILK